MVSLIPYDIRKKNSSHYFAIKAVTYFIVLILMALFAYWYTKQNSNDLYQGINVPSFKFSVMNFADAQNNSASSNYTGCPIASIPWPERCDYANNNPNCNYYTALQFCQFYSLQPLWYILSVPYIIVLLYSLGNIADTYFVPPLVKMSKALHMSPSIAGVTLLALGNGAPDISTILVGVFTGKVAFALTDPLGSGLFDGAIVMGAISFTANFRISKLPFIRDVIFYLISIVYVFYIFMDNRVTIYEGIICLVLYAIYVFIVIFGRIINIHIVQKYKKSKQAADVKRNSTAIDDSKEEKIIHKDIELQTMNHDDDQQKEVKPFDAPPLPLVTIETVINDKLVASETEIKEEKEDWTTGYTIQRHISLVRPSKEWHRPDLTILTDEKQSGNQTSPTPTILTNTKEEICLNITAEESLHGCVPEKLDMPPVQGVETLNISKIDVQTAPRESLEKGSTIQEEPKDETAKIEKMKGFKGFIFRLWNLFVDSIGWHEKKWYEKVLFIVVQWLPNLVMNFTIPKVDDAEWNRLYIICIPMFAPIVFLYALGSQYLTYLIQGVFPLAVVVFFAGALVSALFLILLWKYPDKPPKLLVPILVIFAFILCVVWLYIVANEVQNILQATGEAWGIGDAILGVTILAWGNSIGDFVANVAVTRKGFGSMGVGACYGGPMLNLLVGLGIGFTFNPTQLHNFCYPLTGDPVVSFSFIFLIMLLLMSLTVIPLCKFRVRRPYGVILIITYLIYMVFAILASVVPVVQNAFTWTIGRGC